MRALLITGVVLLVVGIASLFVPIRVRERHGVDAGPVSIGVTTTESRKAPPAVSAALIIGGVALMIAGGRGKK
jgi:hypothetical protein